MHFEWKTAALEDLLAEVLDRRGVTPLKLGSDFTDEGHRVISAKVVKEGRIDLTADEPRFVDDETYDRWMKGPLLPDDVIMTSEAPLGEVAYIAEELDWCLGQRLFGLRTKKHRMHGRFLYYALRSRDVLHDLRARATGTTAQGIRQTELLKVLVPEPPPEQQVAIADILGTLDDKAELNRRINETLEAIARAIFNSWFVDFDPVRAKATGEPPESICRRLGLTPDLLALFPDRLIESKLGEIPAGWEVGALGDTAENLRRGVHHNEIPAGTPYIALEHMPRRCIALAEWAAADGVESNKFEFKQGEILFGKLRPYFHKVGVAPVDGVCSTDILVIAPKSEDWFGFVLGHASSDAFVEHTNAGSTGTKMPRTNWTDVARYQIAIPGTKLAEAFTHLVRPSVERIVAAIHESRSLAAVRDTLLPKLLSGELRVPLEGTA